MDAINHWLNVTPPFLISAIAFGCMLVAALAGFFFRATMGAPAASGSDGQEGYIVSAVLGLLALLMGFTFALSVDRFETRRELVVAEANDIGTTYLRAQLLPEPHRDRVSRLLVRYVDNRIELAKAAPDHTAALLETNDGLITDMWTASVAAYDDIKTLPLARAFLDPMNSTIDMDSARKAARGAHVPSEVFALLGVYLIVASGVLGYVLTGMRGRVAAGFLLVLQVLSLFLVMDIDRPTLGGIRESQAPMEALQASIKAQPSTVFDRWRRGVP